MAYVFLSGVYGASSSGEIADVIGRSVTALTVPNDVSVIGEHALHGAKSLENVTFPVGLERIGEYAFADCSACLSYDFSACQQVPILEGANAFWGIASDSVILVPAALYDQWVTAQNWALYADHIKAVEDVPSEYSEGLEYELYAGGYRVTGYGTWDGEDLVIPPTYNNGVDGKLPVVSIKSESLCYNNRIKSARLPDTITLIDGRLFDSCPNFTHLDIRGVKVIESLKINCIDTLEYVGFRDIEEIGTDNFGWDNAGTVYDFTACTAVPILYSSVVGNMFGKAPIIKVPSSLYEEWRTATNWTYYADYIVAEGDEPTVPDEPTTSEYSEGLEYELYADGYRVTGYGTWDGEELVIPPTYNNGVDGELPVVSIKSDSLCFNNRIKSARLPDTITLVDGRLFDDCPNFTRLDIRGVKTIEDMRINCMDTLEYVGFRDIEEIGSGNFGWDNSGTVYDFTACTAVPILNTNVGGDEFGKDPIIKVPSHLKEEWKTATNWTYYADYIVAAD